MDLVLFDSGGTLIDDPFRDVLQDLRPECAGVQHFPKEADTVATFFEYWQQENLQTNFPFASHFLQEEAFIVTALTQLNASHGVPDLGWIPVISVALLKRYRELAFLQISRQPQMPLLRELLVRLKALRVNVAVASNDRDSAARAMLYWAGLIDHLDWVLTSEGLSRKYANAEKPKLEFFHAIFEEIGRPLAGWDRVVYVGDSEKNDIVPARQLGIVTIRYVDRQVQRATWLHNPSESAAEHCFTERKQLSEIISLVLRKK
jgi:FMN phosphatase YigB (HAD superfamily)